MSYQTETREFKDRDEAKIWIIENQLGGRNLVAYDRVLLEDRKADLFREIAERKRNSTLKQNMNTEDKKSCPREWQTRQEKRENSTDYKTAGVSYTFSYTFFFKIVYMQL